MIQNPNQGTSHNTNKADTMCLSPSRKCRSCRFVSQRSWQVPVVHFPYNNVLRAMLHASKMLPQASPFTRWQVAIAARSTLVVSALQNTLGQWRGDLQSKPPLSIKSAFAKLGCCKDLTRSPFLLMEGFENVTLCDLACVMHKLCCMAWHSKQPLFCTQSLVRERTQQAAGTVSLFGPQAEGLTETCEHCSIWAKKMRPLQVPRADSLQERFHCLWSLESQFPVLGKCHWNR